MARKRAPYSDATVKGLRIIAEHGPIRPRQFARLMWPESPSWQRTGKCGPKGVAYGVGIRQKAGAFLSNLHRRGLVYARHCGEGRDFRLLGYVILDEGRNVLRQLGEDAGRTAGR